MGRIVSSPASTGIKNPVSLSVGTTLITPPGETNLSSFTEGVEATVYTSSAPGVIDYLSAQITGTGTLTIDWRVVVDGVEYTSTDSATSGTYYFQGGYISSTDGRMPNPVEYDTLEIYVTMNATTSLTNANVRYRLFENA
ncbi:MAG: hypothetical protein JAY60_18555 [Candidatus Thiodiazotropha weberae]|nr:hypothetical protein [Candidatus Thiodiazotropha weberae]